MNKKNVLLIWPPANSVHGPPLGLATIAGHLRHKRPDSNVQLVDLNIRVLNSVLNELPVNSELSRLLRSRWTQADIVQDALSRWTFGADAPSGIGALPDWECHYLSLLFGDILDEYIENIDYEPDIIGLSVCDNGLIAAIGLSTKLHNRFPDSLIVWGGVSMSENQAYNFLTQLPVIDIIVIGEGEQAIIDIVDSSPNLPSEDFCNILTCKTTQKIKAKRKIYMPTEPAFDLFDLTLYPALEIPMTIARGCGWGRCKFCNETYASSKFQPVDPVRSAQWALKWQQNFRPVSFNLIDSAANSDQEIFDIFVNTLMEGGGLREWRCMLRSSDINKNSIERAVKTGLRTVYFGIESLNNHILLKMAKGTNVFQHIEAIRVALEFGLNVEGDLILFYPDDNPVAIYKTIELIKRYDHLFQKISLSYSRFVPGLQSIIGNDPQKYGIALLPYSLRLARHLPYHLSKAFVPWDPHWQYLQNKTVQTKDLAKAYLELQKILDDLSTKQTVHRYWYELGNTVVLESSGYEDHILDRLFLEGKQRDIWMNCKENISSKKLSELTNISLDAINEFLATLSEAGFILGDQKNWTHAALNNIYGKFTALRNVKSRPDPPVPEVDITAVNLRRPRID